MKWAMTIAAASAASITIAELARKPPPGSGMFASANAVTKG